MIGVHGEASRSNTDTAVLFYCYTQIITDNISNIVKNSHLHIPFKNVSIITLQQRLYKKTDLHIIVIEIHNLIRTTA